MRRWGWLCLLGLAGCGDLGEWGNWTPVAFAEEPVKTPDWAKGAVFYQIFPERFANGNPANDPKGSEPWGAKPQNFNYFGGDLEGVIEHLDHLERLGVTGIYFNPLFTASSNHKYNTANYLEIDPHFGDLALFRRLLKEAHRRGIKVMIDGVFNHTGDDHWAFRQAETQGPGSPTWDWYTFHGFPVVREPKPNYEAWWGFPTLPKLRVTENEAVRDYLRQVVDFWTRQGIDGWRLDVPNEIDSDGFWRAFRHQVKGINPEAYIVGEIWEDGSRWLKGDQFDATMNYPWRKLVIEFLQGSLHVDDFDRGLAYWRERYPQAITNVQFNLLGSHDVERFLTLMDGDKAKLRLACLFQMTYPGTPVVYYGDEIGMVGGKDPDNRRCMSWNQMDRALLGDYARLIALRKRHRALQDGTFETLMRHNDHRLFAYRRTFGAESLVVALNAGHQTRVWRWPGSYRDLLSGERFSGEVLLPAMQGRVLAREAGYRR